jgi:hypothetical protein
MTGSSVPIKRFLEARRGRALGAILGYAEDASWNKELSEEEWQGLRGAVINARNGYHESVLDLLKAETGVVRNEIAIEVIERLDTFLVRNGH